MNEVIKLKDTILEEFLYIIQSQIAQEGILNIDQIRYHITIIEEGVFDIEVINKPSDEVITKFLIDINNNTEEEDN